MQAERKFTPEALADIRHRYLETNELVSAIQLDYALCPSTFHRLRTLHKWPLRPRSTTDLPAVLKLKQEAENAVRAYVKDKVQASALSMADRLEVAVEKELASLELRRASLGGVPADPRDAEKATRTIQRLSDTLYKIRRLRLPADILSGSVAASDTPKDFDEYRLYLARKIERSMRSRRDGDAPSATDAEGHAST